MHMSKNLLALATLPSITSDDVAILQGLGIFNIGDLLAYQPFRVAGMILAAHDRLIDRATVDFYLKQSEHDTDLHVLLKADPTVLKGIGEDTARKFLLMGVQTIHDLAMYQPFLDAEQLLTESLDEDRDPYAPACVLPTCKKFTRNSKVYASFFRQEEIRSVSITNSANDSLLRNLLSFGENETKVMYLGYSVSYEQDWIYCGIHLGEPQGSAPMLMTQDRQIAIIDWQQALRARRQENSVVDERLANTLFHQRAVDEVARATAEEHQYGATSSFAANASTAGSFVAAGAIVGGVGGGISGLLAGLSLDSVTGATGLGTLSLTAAGTAVGSIAGSAAGSLVFSGATALGFVESDAQGNREVVGTSAQHIQQRTTQNASSIRSFWSNIVSEAVEEESQRIRTERVTNHNRIHALNGMYFEVLNEYRVNIKAVDSQPILYLPYKPFIFTQSLLHHYWWFLRTTITDEALVAAIDKHFMTVGQVTSPEEELESLPDIEDIVAKKITVKVNIDGSMIQDIFEAGTIFNSPFGLPIKTGIEFWDFYKNNQLKVDLITSNGQFPLIIKQSAATDVNYVGTFELNQRVPVHTIQAIRIWNGTVEDAPFDFSKLWIDDVSVAADIDDVFSYRDSLPTLGSLGMRNTVRANRFAINGNSSENVTWGIANRLRELFDDIDDRRAALQSVIDEENLLDIEIDRLLRFLNANRYTFTRLILQSTEQEQIIHVLETVNIDDMKLTEIASTIPIGFSGNHILLAMRDCKGEMSYSPLTLETTKLELSLQQWQTLFTQGATADNVVGMFNQLTQYPEMWNKRDDLSTKDKRLVKLVTQLLKFVTELKQALDELEPDAVSNRGVRNNKQIQRIRSLIDKILDFIDTPLEVNEDDLNVLCQYFRETEEDLARFKGKIVSSKSLSLPSPAVFLEPVLSNAKGAEFYDIRRNTHYDLLPSPEIGATDPNTDRSDEINLVPTVPGSNLVIQNPPNYPLPTHLQQALSEAGALDLSTLINSNANSLNSTLANLASLASDLAQASTSLTGSAQEQALSAASDVARQVGEILSQSVKLPQTPQLPKPPKPPKDLEEKGTVIRELERNEKTDQSPRKKKEIKRVMGVQTEPDNTQTYAFKIFFNKPDGEPFITGAFISEITITYDALRLQANDPNLDTNDPIDSASTTTGTYYQDKVISNGIVLGNDISIEKGTTATFVTTGFATQEINNFNTDTLQKWFTGRIPTVVLGEQKVITIVCTMGVQTVKVKATSVKNAFAKGLLELGLQLTPEFLLENVFGAELAGSLKIFDATATEENKQGFSLAAALSGAITGELGVETGVSNEREYTLEIPTERWICKVL